MKPLLWMRLIRDADPPFTAKRLCALVMLALRMGRDGTGFASHDLIAADAQVSRDTAKRATHDARSRGYLVRTKQGGRRGDRVVACEWALAAPNDAPVHRWESSPTMQNEGPNDAPVHPQEHLDQEHSPPPSQCVSTDRQPTGSGKGGRKIHKHEPNARRALATLRDERALPLGDDVLLDLAYAVSRDPWQGYLSIKAATKQSFDGVRDVAAVLRTRLGLGRP